jgi:hypothetical protein
MLIYINLKFNFLTKYSFIYFKLSKNTNVLVKTDVSRENVYKTFSVLRYRYINTSGNWENAKEIFRIDAELYQHGS